MKRFLTGIIFLIFSFSDIKAQDTTITWYDMEWNKTAKEDAHYYRKAYKQGQLYKVYNYYSDGRLQMTGSFADEACELKSGNFIYYYPNEQKKSEGNYENNLEIGHWKQWYYDGALYKEQNYTAGKLDGTITTYHKNGSKHSIAQYVADSLKEETYWDEQGKETGRTNGHDDHIPSFREGRNEGLQRFLAQNLAYPVKARKNGIEGRVLVRFNVDIDGSITDAKVVKSVHPLLDAEALRVIRAMPKWNPGMQKGHPVKVYYMLPISFSLSK